MTDAPLFNWQVPDDPLLTIEQVARARETAPVVVQAWIKLGFLDTVEGEAGEVLVTRESLLRYNSRRGSSDPSLLIPIHPLDALRSYEDYFGMSTRDMLALAAEGKSPDLPHGEAERMYDHWQSEARMAVEEGLIEAPVPPATPTPTGDT